jgi:hypothetical protein
MEAGMARSSVKDEAQCEAIDGWSSMSKGQLINALRTH